VSATPMRLSLVEAVQRGLQYNLGLYLEEENRRAAAGSAWRARSELLPDIRVKSFAARQEINLAAFGFTLPGFPEIIGPFNLYDIRLYASQQVVNFHDIFNARSASSEESAARYSYTDARNAVVLVCANLYLATQAAAARITAAEAQFQTAQALYNLSNDLNRSGLAPGIDVLRAQVEMQGQQQRLTSFRNDFARAKLDLARAIGIPLGQELILTDALPDSAAPPMNLNQALQLAFQSRSDLKSAEALVHAAEEAKKSARANGLPSLDMNADYGTSGQRRSDLQTTFRVAANIDIPLFQGGDVHGRVLQADALLKQRKAESESLRTQIEYEIRTSFLDLQSSLQNLQVAKSTRDLSAQQLQQAQDRFQAGVTNNIEVIQAQQAVSTANENYVSSLYMYNLSKGTLARALGVAEEGFSKFILGEK